jgi:hypothetical protein
MSREVSVAIVVGAVLVAALVAAGVGLSATTKTVTDSGPVQGGSIPDPPADSSSGVIHGLQSTPGSRILGFRLRSSKYVVQVAFIAPPECLSTTGSGQEALLTSGDCTDLPVLGEISGGGTTVTGLRLTIVSIHVTKQCYEALDVGGAWPSASEACAVEDAAL